MGDLAEGKRHLELVLSGKPLETNIQSRKGTSLIGRGSSDPAQIAHESNREVQYGKLDLCQGACRTRRVGTGQGALSIVPQYYNVHHVSRVT